MYNTLSAFSFISIIEEKEGLLQYLYFFKIKENIFTTHIQRKFT